VDALVLDSCGSQCSRSFRSCSASDSRMRSGGYGVKANGVGEEDGLGCGCWMPAAKTLMAITVDYVKL